MNLLKQTPIKKIMKIDREHVKDTFKTYTDNYDPNNPKIKLKIDHTYRVADLCEEIGRSLGLNEEDIYVCFLLGMLHDVGRFEQVKRYNTFIDSQSIPHAQLSADLLFNDGLIDGYLCIDSKANSDFELIPADILSILEKAIRYHSLYRLPADLSDRELMFCNILRDADKIDIIRVNVETPFEDIYDTSLENLQQSHISDEVKAAFLEKHAILRSLKKYPADNLVGHVSLVFELVYPMSYTLIHAQGYLDKLLSFESKNPDTQEFLKTMREVISSSYCFSVKLNDF